MKEDLGLKLLVITPDYSLNGANVVLLELMKVWQKQNYSLVVISQSDGELSDNFREKSEECLVISNVISSFNYIETMKERFDAVFMNTSSVHYYALKFQNMNLPVFWWFHESFEQMSTSTINFIHLGLLSANFHILSVTDKVKRGLKDLYGIESDILHMPIEDKLILDEFVRGEVAGEDKDDEITFFIPSSYTYIKGQDILIEAIGRIPQDYLRNVKFIFAGYRLPQQDAYYQKILEGSKLIDNIVVLDAMPKEQVYEYYKKCSCVMAPSRVDSTPTTIVEALMFSKICIVSDGAGISEYLSDCQNGFVYPCQNVDELMKRILLVIVDHARLGQIAESGRKVYEDRFSPKQVEKNWLNIVNAAQ